MKRYFQYLNLKAILLVAFLLIVLPCVCFAIDNQEEEYQVAVNAFSDGFYDASTSLFKKFINNFPDSNLSVKANIYLVKGYYYADDYRQALEILNNVWNKKQFGDMLDEIYYWLSLVNYKYKNFSESFSWSKKIINSYPDSLFKAKASYLMAESKLKLGDAEEAKDVLKGIIKDEQDQEVVSNSYLKLVGIYFREKQYLKTITLSEDYFKDIKENRLHSEVYFYLAQSYYYLDRWKESLLNYQKAVLGSNSQELNDLIYHGVGLNYLAIGNNSEARVNIDKIKDKELRLFSQGDYYFKAGDNVQALEIFNIFIRDFSKSKLIRQVYLNKGDLLYEMGRINDSIYMYKYILNNFDDGQQVDITNKAHYGLGWGYLKNDKFNKAINEFRDTLENSDDLVVRVGSRIQIADAYQEIGDYDEALAIYEDILKRYPSTTYADYLQFQIGISFLKKEDLGNAFLALKNLKNNFPSSKLVSQAQYYLAVAYFAQEDYSTAKDLLSDFMGKFPYSKFMGKVQHLYGKCFFNEKNYERALSIFRKTLPKIKDDDSQVLVYVDIGNSYLNLARFDQAKKTWEEIIKKYPNSPYLLSVKLQLGGISEKEGNFDEAERCYKEIIEKYPGSLSEQEALFSLGCFYWNRGKLSQAEECLKDLISREGPMASKGKLYLAKILVEESRGIEAMPLYDQLIKLNNFVAKIAIVDKAFLLKKNKDYPQAIDAFKEAVNNGIDSAEIRFNLGLCLERAGNFPEATEEYLHSVYSEPSLEKKDLNREDVDYRTKAYFRIARIYEKSNNLKMARETYRKIIDSKAKEAKIAKIRLEKIGSEKAK